MLLVQEPHRSLLIITTDGSITRYTPDDQPTTNILSLSLLTLPTHDQLSPDGFNPPPTWHPVEQVLPYAIESTLNEGSSDDLSHLRVFAQRWSAYHRVAATALEELTNAGLFFLLQPVSKRDHTTLPLGSPSFSHGGSFQQSSETGSNGRNSSRDKQDDPSVGSIRWDTAFIRLGFLEFATGEVTLWEGGPCM